MTWSSNQFLYGFSKELCFQPKIATQDGKIHQAAENTPPKINMESENHPFEKENHLQNHLFGVSC